MTSSKVGKRNSSNEFCQILKGKGGVPKCIIGPSLPYFLLQVGLSLVSQKGLSPNVTCHFQDLSVTNVDFRMLIWDNSALWTADMEIWHEKRQVWFCCWRQTWFANEEMSRSRFETLFAHSGQWEGDSWKILHLKEVQWQQLSTRRPNLNLWNWRGIDRNAT